MAEKGWIKTYRKILDCWLWTSKEPYDRRSAWMYLLLTANHSDKKIMFNGELITVKRGQILTSIRTLAEKWKWSYDKTLRFLRTIESDGMIEKESDNFRTLINIVNYEVFQDTPNTDRTQTSEQTSERISERISERTSDKQECKELKNDKNVKNIRLSKDNLCQTQNDVRRAVEEWNTLSEYGIKTVSKLSSDSRRYQNMNARIKQYGFDAVMKAIDNIRHSDFLQGKHNGKNWQITFDWFVLPNNFPKVLDGNYNNSDVAQQENGFDLEKWLNE